MTFGNLNLALLCTTGIVWTQPKQQALIDSLRHNFYIPPLVFGAYTLISPLPLLLPFLSPFYHHLIICMFGSSFNVSCENAGRWRGTPNLHRRQTASDQHPTVCALLFFSISRTLRSPSYFRVSSTDLSSLYSVDSWRMHCPVSRSQRCPTLVQSAKTELRQRLVRLLLHLYLHLFLSITSSFLFFPRSFSSPSFPSNPSSFAFSTATSTSESLTCPAQ
jgi:hypothetical protein